MRGWYFHGLEPLDDSAVKVGENDGEILGVLLRGELEGAIEDVL